MAGKQWSAVLLAWAALVNPLQAQGLDIALPTDNDALFSDDPSRFFMWVERGSQRVWQGGQFGFVRSPLEWPGGIVFTQYHEGIDIAPARPGVMGDEVRAIAAGSVVYLEAPGQSQYGNQVLLRHEWDDGPVFSRYAHLQSVQVSIGDRVGKGERLGVLGNSGGALTPERAHLHLEINLMLNETADLTRLSTRSGRAVDGRFSPFNMAGLDAAALYRKHRADPTLSLQTFVKGQPACFTVVTPAGSAARLDILRRHPWLGSSAQQQAPGWKITFTDSGFPIRFEALGEAPPAASVVSVRPFDGKHTWITGGLIAGEGDSAVLAPRGLALLKLLLATP